MLKVQKRFLNYGGGGLDSDSVVFKGMEVCAAMFNMSSFCSKSIFKLLNVNTVSQQLCMFYKYYLQIRAKSCHLVYGTYIHVNCTLSLSNTAGWANTGGCQSSYGEVILHFYSL